MYRRLEKLHLDKEAKINLLTSKKTKKKRNLKQMV